MNIRVINFSLLLFALSITACFNYETQFEGPYEETDEVVAPDFPKELVYVAGGNVYLADRFGRDSLILDNSGNVEIASINNDHTKVIFKKPNENIKVYDIEAGSITDEVPGTSTAIWYDYHANNQTVYFLLSDNNLNTYGPDVLSRKPINLSSLTPQLGDITKGVVVLENGDFIFSSFAPGIFNSRFIYSSNGTDILKQRETNSTRRYLRVNADEDRLWMSDEFDQFLHKYRVSGLSYIGSDLNGYYIGTPTEDGVGYVITEDNVIRTPSFKAIESPGGNFSSVDF